MPDGVSRPMRSRPNASESRHEEGPAPDGADPLPPMSFVGAGFGLTPTKDVPWPYDESRHHAARSRQPHLLRLRRDRERRREPRRAHRRVRRPRQVSDRRSCDALKLRLHLRFRAGYTLFMEDAEVLRGFDWEEAEDITALSEDELGERLQALIGEERTVSYRRRVLQGRIDLIRAELAGRGRSPAVPTLAPEDLARVLLGNPLGNPLGYPYGSAFP